MTFNGPDFRPDFASQKNLEPATNSRKFSRNKFLGSSANKTIHNGGRHRTGLGDHAGVLRHVVHGRHLSALLSHLPCPLPHLFESLSREAFDEFQGPAADEVRAPSYWYAPHVHPLSFFNYRLFV